MRTSIRKYAILGVVAACAITLVAEASAQTNKETKKAGTTTTAPKGKGGGMPGKGTLEAIDKTAMTIKVSDVTYQVTSSTRITKAGKPAMLSDAKVGDEVGLYFKKAADGKMELLSLRIGPKPEAAKPEARPDKKTSG